VFDPTEWTSAGETSWFPAYERWKDARRAWAAEHPTGDLGDMLDLMRDEYEARMEMERECPEPGQDHVSRPKKKTLGYPLEKSSRTSSPGQLAVPRSRFSGASHLITEHALPVC
jgi:hypothetical protein